MTTIPPVITITDELLAELEQLAGKATIARSGNPWFSVDDCCWWTGNVDEADFMASTTPATILALLQHVRELTKDRERLDFMLSEQCIMQSQNGSMSPVVYSLCWPQSGEHQVVWHKSEREAIDQAMCDAARSSTNS